MAEINKSAQINTSATTVATVVDDTEKTKRTAIAEADQLPLTTTTSSSHYELDYKFPAVGLHYDALQPNQTINVEHVNKILGYKIKTHDERKEIVQQWTLWKKDGTWLGIPSHQRKNVTTKEQLANNENMVQPKFNGKTIQKFNELTKWWSLSNPMCMKTEATFTYLAYEMWEKGWEKQWEKEFMMLHGWSYDSKVKENIQNTCERQGYEMKGCM
jgi:hypothetical protein